MLQSPLLKRDSKKTAGTSEQVLALTSHIEAGFQRKLKTGAVFIDLTAAYDTVSREGLLLKFMRVVPWAKLAKILNNMLSNRFFQVNLGANISRWRRLPQGSVLAPILFILYMADISIDNFTTIPICGLYRTNLEVDLEKLNRFFRRWR
jgi:Reverse transcriptase (RNA-dependent DNA polymerase)